MGLQGDHNLPDGQIWPIGSADGNSWYARPACRRLSGPAVRSDLGLGVDALKKGIKAGRHPGAKGLAKSAGLALGSAQRLTSNPRETDTLCEYDERAFAT